MCAARVALLVVGVGKVVIHVYSMYEYMHLHACVLNIFTKMYMVFCLQHINRKHKCHVEVILTAINQAKNIVINLVKDYNFKQTNEYILTFSA